MYKALLNHNIADMTFDERFAMIVDTEWDARWLNKRTRLLRQASFSDPEANITDIHYDLDRIVYRADIIHIEGDESMRKRIG